jgi:hypothetical protein
MRRRRRGFAKAFLPDQRSVRMKNALGEAVVGKRPDPQDLCGALLIPATISTRIDVPPLLTLSIGLRKR